MNDREFDDWYAYERLRGGILYTGCYCRLTFLVLIYWMTSASLAAIIWKGREICSEKIVELSSGEEE